MTARECMLREFQVIQPDASMDEVIRRLKSPDADPIPVCDGDRLIGMVAYRDVAAGAAAGVRRGGQVRARDVVAPDLIYCRETTEVEEAAALMRENDVRVLPVLNAEGRIVGVLTLNGAPQDLAASSADQPNDPGARPR